jgi:Uma2 family endonuclease
MTLLKHKPATYADIEALPPNFVGEILFGSLVAHPRPARDHTRAAGRMGGILTPPFDMGVGGPGGWVILPEPELHLGPHVLVPDVAAWKMERFTEREDGPWYEVVPDWVCEIHSPSTRPYDVGPKRRVYAMYGVEHLWFIDPIGMSLEVFQRQGENWLLTHTFTENEAVCAPPFDAITFLLGALWPFKSFPADSDPKEA